MVLDIGYLRHLGADNMLSAKIRFLDPALVLAYPHVSSGRQPVYAVVLAGETNLVALCIVRQPSGCQQPAFGSMCHIVLAGEESPLRSLRDRVSNERNAKPSALAEYDRQH
jgi:hypothetical protein